MKRIILAVLCATAILTASVHAEFENDARALYDLGLIKGTGETFSMEALDLDRNATRAEACMTLLRMLGKEEKANYQANFHPFTDVPEWASACIGWLYENRIVNGASETYFGAEDIATVKQFSAMTLRALGYNESEGDFEYENAAEKAISIGLFDETVGAKYELLRRDMIEIIGKAMKTNIRDSYRTLAEKLCDDGAVNRVLAEELGFVKPFSLSDAFRDVPETLGRVFARFADGKTMLELEKPAEHYGLRVFYMEKGGVMAEMKTAGGIRFEKGEISYPDATGAGYIKEIYVYGLEKDKEYSFIVIKTTSEGANYMVTDRSAEAERSRV